MSVSLIVLLVCLSPFALWLLVVAGGFLVAAFREPLLAMALVGYAVMLSGAVAVVMLAYFALKGMGVVG